MARSVRAAYAALAKALGNDPRGAALFDSRDMARRMEAHGFALPAALAPGEGEATLEAFRTDYRELANRRDMRTRGAQREVALELARAAKLTPPLYCDMYDLLTRGAQKTVWADLPGDAARLLELLSFALHADWGRSYDAARFPQEDIAALAAPPLYRVRAPGGACE
jgi:hypothetical protein